MPERQAAHLHRLRAQLGVRRPAAPTDGVHGDLAGAGDGGHLEVVAVARTEVRHGGLHVGPVDVGHPGADERAVDVGVDVERFAAVGGERPTDDAQPVRRAVDGVDVAHGGTAARDGAIADQQRLIGDAVVDDPPLHPVLARPHRPLLTGDPSAVLGVMYADRDAWYREVADAVVEVRPAHEAGEKPKWCLAAEVAEALVELGRIAPEQVATPDELRQP